MSQRLGIASALLGDPAVLSVAAGALLRHPAAAIAWTLLDRRDA